jgi:hypothetical protein
MGTARIRLNPGASARTVVPGIAEYYFTLEFTAPGKTTVNKALNGSMTVMVALEPAVWTLEVKGYTDSTGADLKLSGRTSVPITMGTDSSFDVYLTPGFNSGGKGSLSYNISFPPSARGWFALYPLDDTPGTSREIDISGTGGNASDTLTDLPEGAYRAVIDLYDSAANKSAAWTGAAHIGGGSTTALTRTFTPAGFAACDPPVAADTNTLAAKLDAALASPSGAYTIVLDGTETDLGSFAPKTLNVTGNTDITVTLKGGGNEVQLGDNGNLFTLGADSGSNFTLVLQDVTLRGINSNNTSLVRVENGGTLEMQAGSLFTGNTTPFAGGGVYVYQGTFTMNGGAVSGNAAVTSSYSYGGGVYVGSNGTFNVNEGTVSGNTSSYYGGGVYVGSNGIFAMSGGAVSGNTSSSDSDSSHSGGVHVGYDGTFNMSGGAVSDNVSSSSSYSFGGGVYVNGTFNMNGGTVRGNVSSSTTTSSSGGGVYVGGSFNMSGGAVSDNVSSSSSYSSGGGVHVGYDGTFNMSGGAVSGNSSSSGGGVYAYGTFNMSGGAVSGNILSGTATRHGREVMVIGTFKLSGDAWPERVALISSADCITISDPLTGGTVFIDLGITGSAPLANWVGRPVLVLDSSYDSGNLATLKDNFTLGNTQLTASPYTKTPIPGNYTIGNDGKLTN